MLISTPWIRVSVVVSCLAGCSTRIVSEEADPLPGVSGTNVGAVSGQPGGAISGASGATSGNVVGPASGATSGGTTNSEVLATFDSGDPTGSRVSAYVDNTGLSRVEFRFASAAQDFVRREAFLGFHIAEEPSYDIIGGLEWRFRDVDGSFAYPKGGLSFSFNEGNRPLSIPLTKLGIKFLAKGAGSAQVSGITVEFPTVDTEVAGPTDQFTTRCTCGAAELPSGTITCAPTQGVRLSSAINPNDHTCLAHFKYPLRLAEEWRAYAVLFKDLQWADEGKEYPWVDKTLLVRQAIGTDDPPGWDRNSALKILFAPYRPGVGEGPSDGFIAIDDLAWVVAEDRIIASGPLNTGR